MKRRIGTVLDSELDPLRHGRAEQLRRDRQPEVDPGRHAGPGDAIPVSDYVAATSVGIVGGMPLLDLAYEEDSKADVDMNIVKTSDGRFIEIQGTAEAEPFGTEALTGLLALADKGINDLVAKQREIVGAILGR